MLRESALPERRSARGIETNEPPSLVEREQFLRDLPDKLRELHLTLWLAEAELDGPTPEMAVGYLKMLAEEIEEAVSHFH
jgi:hypothetical protein